MQQPTNQRRPRPASRRDLLVAFTCGGVVALMVGASFAAVPFYNWFCRTTGYAGTTQRAHAAPAQTNERTMTVYFDSNIVIYLIEQSAPWGPKASARMASSPAAGLAVASRILRSASRRAANTFCRLASPKVP